VKPRLSTAGERSGDEEGLSAPTVAVMVLSDNVVKPANVVKPNVVKPGQLVSGRHATAVLEGEGVSRRHGRRLLANGFVGDCIRSGGATLYDLSLVTELAARPQLSAAEIDSICPWGVFVARRDVSVSASESDQLLAVSGGWRFSIWTAVWIRARVSAHGYLPLVATVAGFVAAGGEITDAVSDVVGGGGEGGCGDGRSFTLRVGAPGSWFDRVRGHRLVTAPGRPWVVRGWDRGDRIA
jgi:hypothetical protein